MTPGRRRLASLAAAALPCLLLLAAPARADEPVTFPEGELPARAIAAAWADANGRLLVTDPTVDGIRVVFTAEARLDLAGVAALLEAYEVTVVEGPGTLLQVLHRRNLQSRLDATSRVVSAEQVPDTNELVTAIYRVRHGAGQQIFAMVRGLMTRDVRRIANLLYVQGPELIIVQDLGRCARYYLQVIDALDAPAVAAPEEAGGTDVVVAEVPRGRWVELRREANADARAAALGALLERGEATLLEHAGGPLGGTIPFKTQRAGIVLRDGEVGACVVELAANGTLKVQVSVTHGEDVRLAHELEVALPPAAATQQTLFLELAGREGPTPTHVVVLVRRR